MFCPRWVFLCKTPTAVLFAASLLLSGCADIEGACDLGLAHRDCPLFSGEQPEFPSDDVICRSYGMKIGSKDYAACRASKASIRNETKTAIDTEWWKNGL
jgi:hypothetical protein